MQPQVTTIYETVYLIKDFYNGIKKIVNGDDQDTSEGSLFYNMMMDYMMDGEMPYGTMKARDGDPYEWTYARIEADYAPDYNEG